jgi:GNAT superfamily N-acetyltransferase
MVLQQENWQINCFWQRPYLIFLNSAINNFIIFKMSTNSAFTCDVCDKTISLCICTAGPQIYVQYTRSALEDYFFVDPIGNTQDHPPFLITFAEFSSVDSRTKYHKSARILRDQVSPNFQTISYCMIDTISLEKNVVSTDMLIKFWAEYNTETITPYKLIERLRNSNSKIVLAVEPNRDVIGFGVFTHSLLPLPNKFRIELHALFVQQDKRLKGIGRNLVKAIADFGRSIGCKLIHVPQGIECFYKKVGFKKQGLILGHDLVL